MNRKEKSGENLDDMGFEVLDLQEEAKRHTLKRQNALGTQIWRSTLRDKQERDLVTQIPDMMASTLRDRQEDDLVTQTHDVTESIPTTWILRDSVWPEDPKVERLN